jgi:hypothetical protein
MFGAAPNIRASGFAAQNGEAAMNLFTNNDSTNTALYDRSAPENLGDNPTYDQMNMHRWSKPFTGGRSKKRRYTRRRIHKYKPKRKRQTRKKTFSRNRK